MRLQDKYKTLFNKYGVNTPLRVSHFMAQIEHESGLKPISENLNYSSERLLIVFKKYFTKESALAYDRKPIKIGSRVYASRMGNGDEASKDGYTYRGRGFIQITGKDNYRSLSNDTGIDFVKTPDLLLEEVHAMVSALWFWKKNNLNVHADRDEVVTITKKINGGTNGIEHRKELLAKYKKENKI
jgi:putative chitinase